MRISDWSSDVCSSDLVGRPDAVEGRQRTAEHVIAAAEHPGTFQRPEIGNAFHHAEQAFVAAAVGADGAGIAAVEVAAGRAGMHAVADIAQDSGQRQRSEEHTSELQSLMRNSYEVFCLKKKNDH